MRLVHQFFELLQQLRWQPKLTQVAHTNPAVEDTQDDALPVQRRGDRHA